MNNEILGVFLEYGYGRTYIEVSATDVKGVAYIRITRNCPGRNPRSLAMPRERIAELIDILQKAL